MSYDLKKILPHKPPMIFLDDVVEYSIEEQTLVAKFKVGDKKILFDRTINGINSLAGIEFMAQAIGCYSYFKNPCIEPKPGLLLGTRLFNNSIEKFDNGKTYTVFVHEAFFDNEICAFDCKILDENKEEIQSAGLKVYKSDNIEEMLK